MKRSEAIDLIMHKFEMEGNGTIMREKDAYMLLDTLEKVGMMPPPKFPNEGYGSRYFSTVIKNLVAEGFFAWEPETNETNNKGEES